ncbi:unnamed protein product [Danaus chrysippus]|uniref:(African queen) hypothetical protein n=1 Tax=Danaus chrysippus TaxID=151541 RepID=A0A8J2R0F5_9NEOP|nr:unnamed protein product [Danaus chrysippus]
MTSERLGVTVTKLLQSQADGTAEHEETTDETWKGFSETEAFKVIQKLNLTAIAIQVIACEGELRHADIGSHITVSLKSIMTYIHCIQNNEPARGTHHRRKLQNTAARARAPTNKQTHNIVPTLPPLFGHNNHDIIVSADIGFPSSRAQHPRGRWRVTTQHILCTQHEHVSATISMTPRKERSM